MPHPHPRPKTRVGWSTFMRQPRQRLFPSPELHLRFFRVANVSWLHSPAHDKRSTEGRFCGTAVSHPSARLAEDRARISTVGPSIRVAPVAVSAQPTSLVVETAHCSEEQQETEGSSDGERHSQFSGHASVTRASLVPGATEPVDPDSQTRARSTPSHQLSRADLTDRQAHHLEWKGSAHPASFSADLPTARHQPHHESGKVLDPH